MTITPFQIIKFALPRERLSLLSSSTNFLFFSLLHGMFDVDASTLFTPITYSSTPTTHSSTRGHNFKLRKSRAHTNLRLNSFSNRVINDWNSLPSYVVDAPSLSSFMNLLDEHWTNYQYNCIDKCVFMIRIHRLCLFPVI